MDTGYEYEFVSEVPVEYICIICHLPMRKPVQTKCGHRFCRECLLQANKRKRVPVCPTDRQSLEMNKEKLFDDKAIERSILSLIIKCPNAGCEWQGELRYIDNHKPNCDYRIAKCPITNCDVKKPWIEMRVHELEECQWREVSCPYCREIVISRELENHKPNCDYRIVKCPIRNCDVKKPWIEIRVHQLEECEWREVSCPYCKKIVISRELEKHNDSCPRFPVECPNGCDQSITRRTIEEHIDNHCPKSVVSCSYRELGCKFECPRENLDKHLKKDGNKHLSLVLGRTTELHEKLKQRFAFIEKDSRNHEVKLKTMNNDLRVHQIRYEKMTSKLQDTEKQTQLLIENTIKFKSVVERERKHVWRFLVSIVIGIIAILAFTSRQIGISSQECTVLREKLENKVIWVVNKERSFVKDFYTNKYGYKLRIAALRRPAISKPKEENFFSFAVALLRGEYDAILTWPLSRIIKVTLLDQNENLNDRQNVEVVVDPKEYQTSKNLKRPATSLGIPFVFKKIILEEHLNATNYLFEGSLFLLIETLRE